MVVIRCGLVRWVLVLPVVETAAFAALMPWLRGMARVDVLRGGGGLVRVYSVQMRESVEAIFALGCLLVCFRLLKQETRRSRHE